MFLNSEKNRWLGFMNPGNGGYEEGQFYAGLRMIEGDERDKELPFEELLLKLAERLRQKDEGPCHVTNAELRIGTRRVLWKVHNSFEQVKPAYSYFADRLRAKWSQYGIISFNWDLQTERLLDQAEVPWQYSWTPKGRLPVIKPHGSINWNKHRREGSEAHDPDWVPVGDTKLSFYARKPLEDVGLDEVVPDFNYMLFPGDPDSPADDDDIKLLWRDADRLMDRAEEVVFIGYSFPDYDHFSQQFFKEKVRDKKIIAVNPSKFDLQKFVSILGTEAAKIELLKEKFLDCPYAQPVTDTGS